MKILFLFKYHQGQIDHIESKANKISLNTYQKRMEFVTNQSSHLFLSLINHFVKLGHLAELIAPNFNYLQAQWATENNCDLNEDWQFSLPQKQIEKMQPDILFLSSNFEYYDNFAFSVKPFVKKICAWISCPFSDKLALTNIDHIFTLFEPHYRFFQNQNINTTLTHAGFDAEDLKKLNFEKIHDVTFIGGIGQFHKVREKYLKKLVKTTPLKIWGYGFKSKHPIKNLAKQVLNGFAFRKAYQGEAWGVDMLQVMANSKICFNIHGDISFGHAVNMRMFEATGLGCLLVTEYNSEIASLFIPDKEIVCYKTPQEAIEKINYYLEHQTELETIAQAGQRKCLANYNLDKLAQDYLATFDRVLKDN